MMELVWKSFLQRNKFVDHIHFLDHLKVERALAQYLKEGVLTITSPKSWTIGTIFGFHCKKPKM